MRLQPDNECQHCTRHNPRLSAMDIWRCLEKYLMVSSISFPQKIQFHDHISYPWEIKFCKVKSKHYSWADCYIPRLLKKLSFISLIPEYFHHWPLHLTSVPWLRHYSGLQRRLTRFAKNIKYYRFSFSYHNKKPVSSPTNFLFLLLKVGSCFMHRSIKVEKLCLWKHITLTQL